MKIIYVTPTYYPFLCGGSSTSYYLLKRLAERHEVVVIAPNARFPVESPVPRDSPPVLLTPSFRIPYKVSQVTQFLYMRGAVARLSRDADVVLIQHNMLRPTLPLAAQSDAPVVAWTHDASPEPCTSFPVSWIERLAVQMNRRYASRVAKFTSANRCARRILSETLRVPVQEIDILPNPVATEVFYPDPREGEMLREEMGLRAKIVLSVGLVHRESYLALARLSREEGIEVLFIGRPPVEADGPRVVGRVEQLRPYYNAADLVVARAAPARCFTCSQPTKALEALATGTPVACYEGTCDEEMPVVTFRESSEILSIVKNTDKSDGLRRYVLERHDSNLIAARMEEILKEVS